MESPPASLTAPETVAEEARRALRRAVRLLSQRGRSSVDLRAKLLVRHSPAAVEEAMTRLEAAGFLDDRGWAESYVNSVRAAERASPLLQRELRARGIEDELAVELLAERDDLAAARAAAERRARSLASAPREVRERRLAGYLARRGFGASTVRAVLEGLRGEREE